MSGLSIATRDLVGLLADALETTDPKPDMGVRHAVLLHTTRGPWRAMAEQQEPGERPLFDYITSDLLAATSYDGSAVSQGHAPCSGRLPHPVLISVPSVKAITAVFKPLVKASSLPKTTTHRATLDCPPELLGLEVREDRSLVEDGASVLVPQMDTDLFSRRVMDMLTPLRELAADEVPAAYGTGVSPAHFAAVAAVAERRKMDIAWYRHHQGRRMVATVGQAWRFVCRPVALDTEEYPEVYDEPQVPVYDPQLPAVAEVQGEQEAQQHLVGV